MKIYHKAANLLYFILLSCTVPTLAQAPKSGNGFSISLNQAVDFSKEHNKWVMVSKIEQEAVLHDKKDVINGALPQLSASASYQRFSDLVQYTDGLGGTVKGARRPTPNGANLSIDALFNIYAGGRQVSMQSEASVREKLAEINYHDQTGNVGLQTATQYLDMVRLNDLLRFTLDQLKRAEARLKNINSLYKNQKVTRSDVLRAEVNRSNVALSLQQVKNDLEIANQKLNVIMNLPDSVIILPSDSAGMLRPSLSTIRDLMNSASSGSYGVQKAAQNTELQSARLSIIKSNGLPTLSFYSAYGFNYPNFLFYPPVDQMYSIGFVGLKAQYNIASLYQNKHKVSAAKLRIKELELLREAVSDQVSQEAKSYFIKYGEALNRISVTEKSIEQASVNLKIVSTKYFNQLALLTDLLDADNLYQESRFNLIKAQVEASLIYYRLRYATGDL